jgi:hypothetical protein
MSAQQVPEDNPATAHKDEMMSALFAHMVMQQSNLAMMLMGKVAHPQTGETTQDLEAAKLFIDQLEMLESKTSGNLTDEETRLLKQTLMKLRMTFVELVEASPPPPAPSQTTAPAASSTAGGAEGKSPLAGAGAEEEDEHRKKFSKKY